MKKSLLQFLKQFLNIKAHLVVFHIRNVEHEKPTAARKMRNFISSKAVRSQI